jgi:hypothetical protein
MSEITLERVKELRAWLKDFHEQWETCDCEDCIVVKDLLAILDNHEKLCVAVDQMMAQLEKQRPPIRATLWPR